MQPATNAWRLARAGAFRRGVGSGVRSELTTSNVALTGPRSHSASNRGQNSDLAPISGSGAEIGPDPRTHEQNQPGVDSSLAGADRGAATGAGAVDGAADLALPGPPAGPHAHAVPAGAPGRGLALAPAHRPRRPRSRPRGSWHRGPADRAA